VVAVPHAGGQFAAGPVQCRAAALARCIPEWRRGPVRHTLATLVRQRVFQIACGYADQDDADHPRSDPLLKLACGRLPRSGADLASQPTFSRLENAVDRHAVEALATVKDHVHQLLAKIGLRNRTAIAAACRGQDSFRESSVSATLV